MANLHDVEVVDSLTSRLRVPGGWLYRWRCSHDTTLQAGFVFVPDPVDGADAPAHVCGHGYAARTCALCERDGMFRKWSQ